MENNVATRVRIFATENLIINRQGEIAYVY